MEKLLTSLGGRRQVLSEAAEFWCASRVDRACHMDVNRSWSDQHAEREHHHGRDD
jgi:hypothetical protein